MAALSDYLENKLIDFLLRGQAFSPSASTHVALFTAAPSDTGGGTEVTGGSYARVAVTSALTSWAGTQSAGSTTASTGNTGTTTNNADITFATPSAGWGTVVAYGLYDAPTGGNLLIYGGLTTTKVINTGDTVKFSLGTLSFQIDN
jgi:hypothetical protein